MAIDRTIVSASAMFAALGLVALYLRRKHTNYPQAGKTSGIKVSDLRDPSIRADHIAFNNRLLREFPDDDAIELDDTLEGSHVFLVHRHAQVMQVISDHVTFTSNPWPGSRSLVTLNTMDKADHDRVFRLLKRFYTPAAVSQLEELLRSIVDAHGQSFERDGDAYRFAKRVHMHLSLLTSGVYSSIEAADPAIDQFIQWNDSAVLLAAPLGGVGGAPRVTWTRTKRLLASAGKSLPGMWGLIRRIGIWETFKLINPIESFWPSAPYTHCWDYPDHLPCIPEYFNRLFDTMATAHAETPAGVLFQNIGESVSASEALATLVQLMVNMTTANSTMSLIYRRIMDPNISPEQVLLDDAPLQRNPRRATKDGLVGGTRIPKGSIVLLMLGAANTSCPAGGTAATFGFGLHHCIGRHLVSLEMQIVSEWLKLQMSGKKPVVEGLKRLVDRDVGNWGFLEFKLRFT